MKDQLSSLSLLLALNNNRRTFRSQRAKRGEGKTAQRAMQILSDAGYEPYCLRPATGYWLSAHADVYCWEVHLKIKGFVHCCGSWETMTEFVKDASKYGFTVNKDDEIYSNKK